MRLTDDIVEKAARAHMEAAWADMRERGLQPHCTWERMEEAAKENIKRRERQVLEAVLPDIIANSLGVTLPDGRRLVGQMWVRNDGKNEYRIVGGSGLDRARLAREFAGLLFQWLTELCELIEEAEAAQGGDEDADNARDDRGGSRGTVSGVDVAVGLATHHAVVRSGRRYPPRLEKHGQGGSRSRAGR